MGKLYQISNEITLKAKAAFKAIGDANGDGKVDQADIDHVLAGIDAQANKLVTKEGARNACLMCTGAGVAGGVIVATLLKFGC